MNTRILTVSIDFVGLKPRGQGLTVVGDDAQAIYSFRAATVRNILDFPNQCSPPANMVTLDRNYRSTQNILAAANSVIGLAAERFTKNLWTDRTSGAKPQLVSVRDDADQARFIVERVLENREVGTLLKQQAVLFRASSHSGPLEIELTRRNVPFVKFGGLKLLDASHITAILALLRFVENPRDRVAGFRLMQLSVASDRPRHSACSTSLRRPPTPLVSLRMRRCRAVPTGTAGGPLSRQLGICAPAAQAGQLNWSALASGMNRISTASMKTPSCAVPI